MTIKKFRNADRINVRIAKKRDDKRRTVNVRAAREWKASQYA